MIARDFLSHLNKWGIKNRYSSSHEMGHCASPFLRHCVLHADSGLVPFPCVLPTVPFSRSGLSVCLLRLILAICHFSGRQSRFVAESSDRCFVGRSGLSRDVDCGEGVY